MRKVAIGFVFLIAAILYWNHIQSKMAATPTGDQAVVEGVQAMETELKKADEKGSGQKQ